MKKILINLLLLLTVLAVSSCDRKISKDFDFGEIKDGIYTNEYFGMTMEVPQDWFSLTQEEIHARQNVGKKVMMDDSSYNKRFMKAAEVQTANMFYVGKEYAGQGFNLQLIAENISHTRISDGKEYLLASISSMETLGMPVEDFHPEITKTTLGGREFYQATLVINLGARRAYFTMYATVFDQFALQFGASYQQPEQMEQMERVIETVKFKQ